MQKTFCLLIAVFFFISAQAFAEPAATSEVEWKAYRFSGELDGITSPQTKYLTIEVTIRPAAHVYLYGPDSKDGLPTKVDVAVSYGSEEKIKAIILAPPPVSQHKTRFAKSNISNPQTLIYDNSVVFIGLVPLKEADASITLSVSALLCTPTNCTPFDHTQEIFLAKDAILKLPVPSQDFWINVVAQKKPSDLIAADKKDSVTNAHDFSYLSPHYFKPELEVEKLGGALLFGLLAGVLLNLMPCVLPVISLKFSSLMAVSDMMDKHEQAKAFRSHCLIFAAGVLSWFLFLALMLGLAGWAWGELFQSPIVICILGMIMFLLALSLFGVFSLPIFDLKVSSKSNPHWQAFASGLLATLLATPCSGPLLGGVLGWALLQPLPFLVLSVSSVGVGMALPYGILALYPRLVHLLPRPGAWTLRLEQLLGFFLFGSVVYLVTLLPKEWISGFLMNLFAVAFAAWLWGQIGHLGASKLRRAVSKTCAIFIVILALWWGTLSTTKDLIWEPFDPVVFEDVLGKEPLLVQFTADWCPSCKALEHTTLNEKRMTRLQKKYNMRLIRVDMTREDETAKELLNSLGSNSIPILALFPQGSEAKAPLVLRDIVTPQQLKDALSLTF